MRSWATDAAVSVVEAAIELLDGFTAIRPRTYLVTALVVAAITCFAAWGPSL